MLTAPQAKVLLKNHKNDLMPVIVWRQTIMRIRESALKLPQ